MTGALGLAVSGCRLVGLQDVPLPGGADLGSHPYSVSVDFADVLDLVPQSAVRVNDVPVGRVDSIALRRDRVGWHAHVKLELNGDVELPANARADLRQTSLLGEKYVSLGDPTSEQPHGRLHPGATIPLARSGRNPQVEEVLGALSLVLNGGGLAQLQTIERELGDALDGHETQIRDVLAQLDTLVGGLDAQRTHIVHALDAVDTLAKTLAAQRTVIAGALDDVPGALTVLADQRRQLTSMLTALHRLGQVGSQVITASRDDVLADLRALSPTLSQLAAAGTALPGAFELLLTYPFPKTATNGIQGDYTNLFVTVDLDVSDILDNLITGPAGTTAPPPGGAPVPAPAPPVLEPGQLLPGLPSIPGLLDGSSGLLPPLLPDPRDGTAGGDTSGPGLLGQLLGGGS